MNCKIYNINLDNIINTTTNDFGYRYYRDTIAKTSPTTLNPYRIINITEINKISIDENNFVAETFKKRPVAEIMCLMIERNMHAYNFCMRKNFFH